MDYWLPLIFVSLMGLSLLLYIILDGYDLGIGILLPLASDDEKDRMIETIGPFWDANETWIVLGIGILLIAFPSAHGMILTHLYIPVTLMLFGLILRGVAFDFRVKVTAEYKSLWNKLFFVGSLLAAMSQGWMLGSYVMGLESGLTSIAFSIAIALSLPAFYVVLGCGWLFIKSSGEIYTKAAKWARTAILPMGVGLFLISIATPIASSTIAAKWFTLPAAIGLLPIPLMTGVAYFTALWVLSKEEILKAGYGWIVFVFVCMVVMCLMMALGLAYSIFPDIVIGKLDIWESASSTASLEFALIGTVIAVPMILFYTAFIYKNFLR
tara:strand:- start:106864 stop:107838 length:975 start_codon:yes stop_codon:yes gene_type:complete